MSLLVLTHYGVSSRPQLPQDKESFFENHRTQKSGFLFQGVSVFFFAGIAFTTISYSSMSTKLSIQPLHSPGKWRVVTPGTAITRPTENICGNSTCPKTPQSGFLEETEAVPAESINPERSRTARNASYRIEPRSYFTVYINYED